MINNMVFKLKKIFSSTKCLLPKERDIFVGLGDFEVIGNEFKKYFIDAGLKPNAIVLDAGCGIGRMAVPLVNYLNSNGEYWGIDIVKKGIKWCNKNISRQYPNFKFIHADIYNKFYNPEGKERASAYRFPFKNNNFDFIFLTSVFTHLLPDDLENYLSEISRILKNGGILFITYFILNEESELLIKKGESTLNFQYEINPNCLTTTEDNPEAALIYKEAYIKNLYEKNNLTLKGIFYGNWCNRINYLSYQDILIAQKK